jgi:hypothetical protein
MGWFDTWFSRIANAMQFATFDWSKWLAWAIGFSVLAAIGQMIESATVTEIVVVAVAAFVVLMVAFLAIHAWRSRPRPAPPQPSIPVAQSPHRGGRGSPVMTAGENSSIHYTYSDNRTTIYVLAGETPKKSGEVDVVATLKLDARRMELLDAFNISSVTDVSSGHIAVNFAQTVNPAKVHGHSLSASTAVAQVTASSADIRFDEKKTGVIEVKFESTSRSG